MIAVIITSRRYTCDLPGRASPRSILALSGRTTRVQNGGEMKTTKQMAHLITSIAEEARIDLSRVGGHLRIENPPYMPLSIEAIGKNLVSVTHNYEQNGDLVPDP